MEKSDPKNSMENRETMETIDSSQNSQADGQNKNKDDREEYFLKLVRDLKEKVEQMDKFDGNRLAMKTLLWYFQTLYQEYKSISQGSQQENQECQNEVDELTDYFDNLDMQMNDMEDGVTSPNCILPWETEGTH